MALASMVRSGPGLVLVFALTALAYGLAHTLAHFTRVVGVGALPLGILLGLLVANTRPPPAAFAPGVDFAGRRLLAAAVVLLGLQVSFQEVARFGLPLAIAFAVVVGSFVLAMVLGRGLGMDPRFSALIGAGTGVCGVAAVAAVRPVVAARQHEMVYAVASVTLLGTLGLIGLPFAQWLWHPLDPHSFGVLAGAGLHSVPQAVGAGFAGGGQESGTVATVVKLTRVALLGPLVLGLVALWRTGDQGSRGWPRLPVEVWGFLLVVLVGNLVPLPRGVGVLADAASGLLLVVALTALGLSTRLRDLRGVGVRPLLLALSVWVVVLVGVFALLRVWM